MKSQDFYYCWLNWYRNFDKCNKTKIKAKNVQKKPKNINKKLNNFLFILIKFFKILKNSLVRHSIRYTVPFAKSFFCVGGGGGR